MYSDLTCLAPNDATLKDIKLLSAYQVAELLSVHVTTVWRLTQRVENPLPVVRFGGRITRFRLADIEKFLNR
jgi:excisionase family DNA binding protein